MVRIGSEAEHVDLTLTAGPRAHLVATLTGAALQATRAVVPHYSDDGYGDLVEYFAHLANYWRGWVGDRTWTSLEDELSFTARHTGSHVHLTVSVENGPFNGTAPWSARLALTLDAGEQLSSVAASVADEIGR